MNRTNIEWTDMTWNPVTGCYHGCDYCYGKKIAHRFSKGLIRKIGTMNAGIKNTKTKYGRIYEMGKPLIIKNLEGEINRDSFPFEYKPTFHKYRLDEPAKRQKSSKIFVCSMADLFGEWVPAEWIWDVFDVVTNNPQHTFQFLTKRPDLIPRNYSPQNAWFGTTIESQKHIERAKHIQQVLGPVRFISFEPLLGPINLLDYLEGSILQRGGDEIFKPNINWVIIGAQTGPGAVKPEKEWVDYIIEQCREVGIPVFLKDNLNWPEKIQEWPEGVDPDE